MSAARVCTLAVAAVCIATAAATGFWEAKPAAEWTVEEVRSMLSGGSPWSRTLRPGALRLHLASARPMREAEARERTFERRTGAADASFADYQSMLDEGRYIALAIAIEDRDAFSDGDLVTRMQKDSEMRTTSSGKPLKLVTYFPPSSSDPYLRLLFPRPATLPANVKSLFFTILVPGAQPPYRNLEFPLKELAYRGKPEF